MSSSSNDDSNATISGGNPNIFSSAEASSGSGANQNMEASATSSSSCARGDGGREDDSATDIKSTTMAAAAASGDDSVEKVKSDGSNQVQVAGADSAELTRAGREVTSSSSTVTVAGQVKVEADALDPSTVGSSSNAAACGHNSTNRQYPSASSLASGNHHLPQKTHYNQWPLPPHTYAAGRHHSSGEEGANNNGGDSTSAVHKDARSDDALKNSLSSHNSNDDDEEELLIKNDSKKKKMQQPPQAIYSSNTNHHHHHHTSSSAPPPPLSSSTAAAASTATSSGWGNNAGSQQPHPNPHPLHPSHPHHPHHAQYQAHYQQWYRHYAHHHHHQQQQQQQQQRQQQPPPHVAHPHYPHWHRQQQPPPQHAHYPSQMKSSSTDNTNHSHHSSHSNQQQQPHHHHHHHSHPKQAFHHHHASTIYPTRSNDSSNTTTTNNKRTVRELSTVESRDDTNTVVGSRRSMEENNNEEQKSGDSPNSSCAMSLGDFSMASLGSSSPKGKRRKGTSRGGQSNNDKSFNDDDTANSLEFSDKEIMNNLSMNSSYSSDMAAMLYGTSPSHSVVHHRTSTGSGNNHGLDDEEDDSGKTPKKNNTSSKKPRPWSSTAKMDDAVFRLDSMTPRFRSASDNTTEEDGSSPALLDLIGGAETPTTGLLMSSIENAMMDDISLNRNLRGHAFTPLPHIMGSGGDGMALGGSGGDASGLSITPQLSWSTNNGSPLDITPRCFGLLDSTKSTNKNPLGSPKSFWKDNTSIASSDEKRGRRRSSGEKPSILSLLSPTMREMEISHDASMEGSRSTTPLPLNYGKREQQKDAKKEQQEHVNKRAEYNQNTPVQKHHPGHGHMMRGQQQQQPPMHHMQASPWAQLGGYMPSPVPGAFPSMSPGFGLYPQMEPNHHNDRVRNLRGRGPPVHAIPPSHRLPPPSYHHFSPLTNVMKRPSRPMAYHHPHGNVPPQVDVSSSSKSNCVPMKPPIPSKFQGDMNKYKDVAVPDFNNLVNFPCHMNQKSAPAPDGTRNCVMCGHSCPCTTGGKQKGKNNSHPLADNNQNKGASGMNNNFAIIPSQNKGLCTLCDVNVWIVVHSGLEIKWCKGCKNFRPWAAFGEKGLATKCVRCRERQREKYAMEKEKKERAKLKQQANQGRAMTAV